MIAITQTTRARHRSGLTLIEVMVSLVLVSTILLVSLSASASLFRNQSEARVNIRALELAGQFLDEISVRAFVDADDNMTFGVEDDETATDRSTFDDIDDYDGYAITTPTYRDGQLIGGYAGWTVQVGIQRADPIVGGLTITTDDDSPLRIATVTCTAPNSFTTSASIVVSNVTSDLNTETTSYDRLRRVNFSFSADRAIELEIPLRNQPTASN